MRASLWKFAIIITLLLSSVEIASMPASLDRHVNVLYGTKAGVDQDDNLWFWRRDSHTITRLSPDGVETKSAVLPSAWSVDADVRRGIAALTEDGDAIQILTWTGNVMNEIRLTEPAGDIVWMSGSLVAVTPLFAEHRIEVWDSLTSELVRTIDPTLPISRGSGEHIARATLVRYDRAHDQLVALDSTFGRLFVYDAAGELIRDTRLTVSPTPIHQWLSQPDAATHRREGHHTSVIWRFPALTIDRDGAVWVSGDVGVAGDVTFFKYTPDGLLQRTVAKVEACPSRRLQIWQDQLVLFRDLSGSSSVCTAILGETSRDQLEVLFNGTPQVERPVRNTHSLLMRPNATNVLVIIAPPCYGCTVGSCPPLPGWRVVQVSASCCHTPDCNYGTCCWVCYYEPAP